MNGPCVATGAAPFAVVKLGGSIARGDRLRRWLQAAAALAGPVAIAPGGGVFADAVRQGQREIGYDDRLAHRLALTAMSQLGAVFCDLEPRLVPAPTERALREAIAAGRIPVWSPEGMAADGADIAQNWDMTSDSLAAWLAGRLGAARLILVKSAPPDAAEATSRRLAENGVVDRLFPDHFKRSGAQGVWLGPEDWPVLAEAAAGRAAGARIVPE
jgi:aspartokinase-like uncharacterized kinase